MVARLDRRAEEILRTDFAISYPRLLTLLTAERLGAATQRELATELGVSEPAVSRTVTALAAAGWLESTAIPGGGNRRQVRLTPAGQQLVDAAASTLERAFAALLDRAALSPADVLAVTTPLLAATEESP